MTKPVGDACRDDGTLKDASEMVWADSPTALEVEAPPGQNYNDELESYDDILYGPEYEGDNLPMAKVTLIL